MGINCYRRLRRFGNASVLFRFIAVLDPRVGHTMDLLSPYVSVICHFDRLFIRISSLISDHLASKLKLTSRFGFICSQISQLLGLVTQCMATNELVINRSADDGTLMCRSAECLQEPPTDGGYFCSDPISTYYISLLVTQHVV